jgi:hypothetical protein
MWFIWNYVCVCTQLHGHSICKNCQNLSWGIFFLEAMCLHFLGVWGQDTFPFCAQTLSFPLHHPLLNNITLSDSQFYQDGLYFNAHLSYHTHTHTHKCGNTQFLGTRVFLAVTLTSSRCASDSGVFLQLPHRTIHSFTRHAPYIIWPF